MKHFVVTMLLLSGAISAAQEQQTIRGVVTDDMCPLASHGQMKMGDTDGECARACIDAHGAVYVLYDGTSAYTLSDQKAPAAFAGQRVRVSGAVDAKAKTIRVASITPDR